MKHLDYFASSHCELHTVVQSTVKTLYFGSTLLEYASEAVFDTYVLVDQYKNAYQIV